MLAPPYPVQHVHHSVQVRTFIYNGDAHELPRLKGRYNTNNKHTFPQQGKGDVGAVACADDVRLVHCANLVHVSQQPGVDGNENANPPRG